MLGLKIKISKTPKKGYLLFFPHLKKIYKVTEKDIIAYPWNLKKYFFLFKNNYLLPKNYLPNYYAVYPKIKCRRNIPMFIFKNLFEYSIQSYPRSKQIFLKKELERYYQKFVNNIYIIRSKSLFNFDSLEKKLNSFLSNYLQYISYQKAVLEIEIFKNEELIKSIPVKMKENLMFSIPNSEYVLDLSNDKQLQFLKASVVLVKDKKKPLEKKNNSITEFVLELNKSFKYLNYTFSLVALYPEKDKVGILIREKPSAYIFLMFSFVFIVSLIIFFKFY